MEDELKLLRQQIDAIDAALVDFLNTRLDIVQRIADLKQSAGAQIADPAREAAILEALREQAEHPLLKESIADILEPLFRCSKQIQKLGSLPKPPFARVGIVGLGLLGSSIARGLKLHGVHVSAVDPWLESSLPEYIDQSIDQAADLVGVVDCVMIATPIELIPDLSQELVQRARSVGKPLLVLDVASLKADITELYATLSDAQIHCVATHPMAGREQRGAQAGSASLFMDAPWIITPHAADKDSCIDAVETLIRSLGAEVIKLDAQEHDKLCALISHLPGVLASEYHGMVERLAPDAVEIAGPGYRSFTRIAHSNPEMRQQIARGNRNQIQQWLKQYLERIRPHADN